MKSLIIVSALLMWVTVGFSQNTEALIGGETTQTGYGEVVLRFGSVNGTSAVFHGGRAFWLINHAIGIGAGGYELVSNVDTPELIGIGKKRLKAGYAGIALEYVPGSNKLYHLSFELLLGGGSISRDDLTRKDAGWRLDSFYVTEPAVNLDLNVTNYFRFGVGASYRVAMGLSSEYSSDADLSGPSGVITLKFGMF
jgi:hypothetical protein